MRLTARPARGGPSALRPTAAWDTGYGDVLQGECRACHQECASCSGATAGDCLSCHAGKLLFNLTCVDSCPVGHYATADGTQCNSCGVGCAECAPGTGLCTLCKVGQYADYAAGVCYSACPGRFLADEQAKTCAGSVDTCTACRDPAQRLRASTGRCVDRCALNEVEIPGVGAQAGMVLCADCHASCESCHAPDHPEACSSCPEGRLLHGAGTCVSDCPAGHFALAADRRCAACDGSCRTCRGPGQEECLSCSGPGAILLEGSCVSSCPPVGFWLDESDPARRVCRPCGRDCEQCSRDDACTACRAGRVMHHTQPGQRVCLAGCPGGFFAELPAGQRQAMCAACARDCHTCTGPGEADCQVSACQADGSCGPSRNKSLAFGLIIGLSMLFIILLLILLVLFCALRRRRHAPKEWADGDLTIVNTAMDLALPGFLLLSFDEDIRLLGGGPAGGGTQGSIFLGEPLKPALISAAGNNLLVAKMAHGAVSFAAPEVLASMDAGGPGAAPIDHLAADVYSLASVFWHILTHTRPWSGLSKTAIRSLLSQGKTPAVHGPPAREDMLLDQTLQALNGDLLPAMWAADPGTRPPMSTIAALAASP
ncbi:hypothetical protein H696_03274 [Fonticula alba]|uniref:Serine/threonine protein kinase n=1 Tax=Fonticula alba TaxID=691883 RepID=A0A058Z696_FONAL|nr:hypothetical protein H696_03274 [Fonticula alba]KCV69814.1 hypothetical protein H696_03274 [Fonticula alba]|eukprot:XP_009495420.1 hypothetical protein H696_03274 [Fonticula alba]